MFRGISSLSANALASEAGNALYKDDIECVFKLSITKITFSASGYLSVNIPFIKFAQSILVRRSLISICLLPPLGSTSIKILTTPFLTYSSSIRLGCQGAAGIVFFTSPISCLLDSSMQTTGYSES